MSLADIPGLGAYIQRRQMNEQAPLAELQQVQAAQGLLAKMQAQDKTRRYEDAIRALGPDANEAQLAQVVSQFDPVKGLEIRQRAVDKAAERDMQKELKTAQLEQQAKQNEMLHEFRLSQSRTAEERNAEIARHNRAQETLQGELAALRREAAANKPPRQLQIIQTDQGPMQVGPDGKAAPIVGADGQPVKAKGTERALPGALSGKYLENLSNLRRAEKAMALLEGKTVGDVKGDKEATGKKGLLTNAGVLGDIALNSIDPEGVDTRAAIGDLGSLVIHDRSGAAVTAAEFPRLRPFIPLASDSPEVARKKVARFVQEYRAEIEAQKEFFTQSGYKVPDISTGVAPKAPAAPGGLSPEEQKELEALRARFKK